jgi:TolA-binding protein
MPAQRMSRLIAAAAAALVFACAANAQVPRGMGPLSDGQINLQQNGGNISARRYEAGIEALQAGNFGVAEGIFRDILRDKPTHADVNFLMGVTEMALEKWGEAQKYLEVAVRKSPKKADPKSRLGVTLIKLGDREGAMKQRADLEKMASACKNKCLDAKWIAEGIAMIDGAAGQPVTPAAASAPSL